MQLHHTRITGEHGRRHDPQGEDCVQSRRRNGIEVDIVTSRAGFLALCEEWVWLETKNASRFNLFQTFEWNWNWFEAYGFRFETGNARLFIVTTRRSGELTSVWPMMIVRQAGLRVLCWLSEPLLQYGDALVRAGARSDLDLEIAHGAIRDAQDWDCAVLTKVLATARVRPLLEEVGRRCGGASLSSALDLSGFGSPDEYRKSLSKSRRRRHKTRENKLQKFGKLEFDVHTGGPAFLQAITRALEFKRLWLVENGLQSRSMFCAETENFLKALSGRHCLGRVEPLAAVMTLDSEPVAIEIGYRFGLHYYAYLGAFDWNLQSYSPGKVQMDKMIEWCVETGIDTYDLLGTHAAYKSDWTNVCLEMRDYYSARSLTGRIYSALWLGRIRPWMKNTLIAMPASRRKKLVRILARLGSREGTAKGVRTAASHVASDK